MTRAPRIIEPNTIYHVLNRANGGNRIFESDADYLAFERVIIEAKQKFPMRILAYCLMPNHWHFILRPDDANNLSSFMHWLTLTHAQRWLFFHGKVGYGHVYQGRYKSVPVQEDTYFLRLCRYVERNAQRAHLVPSAKDWRWGSAWIRDRGSPEQKSILSSWPVQKPVDYDMLLDQNEKVDIDTLTEIRSSINKGRPFGSDQWIADIAPKLKLDQTLRKPGRPRKL